MIYPHLYTELCKTYGFPLNDSIAPGSDEVALPKNYALSAIESLKGTTFAILGGDVLRLRGGKLEYVIANWYCNRKNDESADVYIERSRYEAEKYVTNFKTVCKFSYEPLFTFVLDTPVERQSIRNV